MRIFRLAAMAFGFCAGLISAVPAVADSWSECADTANPAAAIAACTGLISSAPTGGLTGSSLAAAHFNRGAAFTRLDDHERAIADYSLAIAADPQFALAYNGRGVALALNRQYAQAIEDYDRALGIDSDFADALNNRADALRNQGELERALSDLDRLIAIGPGFAEAWITRGEVYLDQGRYGLARTDLARGLEIDPDGEHRDFALSLMAEIERRVEAARPGASGSAAQPAGPGDERRVALVIGNSAYQKTGRLANPANDASAIAEALRATGFDEVSVVLDADRAAMVDALQAFGPAADAADWAVVYFAGHGIEIGGRNFLIPIDAELASDRDVADEAVTLERVLSAIEGARKLRLVVLDACRNNPFIASMATSSPSRSVGRGLARVEPSRATLVAFAAKEGTLAADGTDGNSPFAAALARRMREAGLEINKVFRFVRSDVLAATDGRQEPFVYGSLPPEDFFFQPPS